VSAPGGLREAHAHLAQHGRAMGMCDLSGCRSAEGMLDRLAGHPAEASGWVLGHGARPEAWDEVRWATRRELDAACAGRPVVAWCFDYHALVASTRALELAGIDAGRAIAGGVIETDGAGEPTGLVLERAALAVWDAVPEPGEDERRAHVRAALCDLASLGYAEVHDLKTQAWVPGVLAELESAGELACDVVCWALVGGLGPLASARGSYESDRVRLGGGKVFTDGTLNSRTAWMLEPYADAPADRPRGVAMMSAPEIDAGVRACDALGVAMAAHAIGDGAVRAVLDSIERVRPRTPGFRVEHAEVIDGADVPRFAELGVVCSVQPCHLLADVEALRRAVPDRLDRVLPLRELIDSGLEPGQGVVFGSDVPIVRADPGDSIRAAVHRRREGTPESEAIALSQAITEPEAWACFALR